MDSNKLKILLVLIFAAFAAIYLGIAAATAQLEAIAWVLGVGGVVFLLALGRHVWALIPVGAVLAGTLTFVPGCPSPWYALTPVATIMLTARFLMRRNDFTYRFCWMDVLIILHIFALAQAYVRNPTGLAILGSSGMIGGRPYMDYGMAIFAYFVLATVKTEIHIVKRVILCMILVALADQLLMAATGFSGGLSRAVSRIYSNVDYDANAGGAGYAFDFANNRLSSVSGLGIVLSQILFSFNRPLECALPWRPLRFLTLLFTGVVVLLSGFRSNLIKMSCFFIAGTVVRRKPIDFVVAAAPAVVFLAVLLMLGPKNLPFGMQRTLSFLPIEVDASIRESAEGSSDWRFEMWRLVLTSDRYIQNKILGDGFGFSADEQEAQMQDSLGLRKYSGDSIDAFIAKGSYHGWHVEAIRFTGVLGLVIGIFILFVFARHAWVIVKHHRGSDFFPYAVYLCIPFLIEPFFTLFVFGSYKGNFITYIAMSAMLRLAYGLYLEERRHPVLAQAAQAPADLTSAVVRQRPAPAYAKRF
jgi:hypothetical protein